MNASRPNVYIFGERQASVKTLEEANRFLREHYIAEFNQKFAAA